MRAIDRNKRDFESKPFFHENVYFPNEEKSLKQLGNQHFVVVWQMEKTKEREIVIE